MRHNPEYRFTTGSGLDRSGNSARTTDKGSLLGRIYSLLSRYNKLKRELTQGVARGPDKNDPFDQFTDISYKIFGVAVALNPSAGRLLFTAEKL